MKWWNKPIPKWVDKPEYNPKIGHTKSTVEIPACSCDVLPWEHCEHTADVGIDEEYLAHLKSI